MVGVVKSRYDRLVDQDWKRRERELDRALRAEERERRAQAARSAPGENVKLWHCVVALIVIAVIVAGSWHAPSNATTAGGDSTPSGVSASTADCDGHNGNAAVAACHPDDDAVQDACPENSNGQEYAAPSQSCLEAVRGAP
jgi:hypothetical protein